MTPADQMADALDYIVQRQYEYATDASLATPENVRADLNVIELLLSRVDDETFH